MLIIQKFKNGKTLKELVPSAKKRNPYLVCEIVIKSVLKLDIIIII